MDEDGLCFVTSFFHRLEPSPNVGCSKASDKNNVYYNCMYTMFYSIRKIYPESRLVLVTDGENFDYIEKFLRPLDVEVVVHPLDLCLFETAGASAFPGCLYLLDAINLMSTSQSFLKIKRFIYLDSDVIMINRIDDNFDKFVRGLTIPYEDDWSVNGVTLRDLKFEFERIYSISPREKFCYFGGEYLSIDPKAQLKLVFHLKKLVGEVVNGFIDKYGGVTEEHILTLVLNHPSFNCIDDKTGCCRLWLGSSYCNYTGYEERCSIVHLPGEKNKYLSKLFLKINPLIVGGDDGGNEFDIKTDFKRYSKIISFFNKKVSWFRRFKFRSAKN